MNYEVKGKVVHATTHAGVPNVRVEAWDKDSQVDDYLGSTSTAADGSFKIIFTQSQFWDSLLDIRPDLYFKVFHCGKLLANTKNSVIWNASSKTNVEIKVTHTHAEPVCVERHIYLKIERAEGYSPVFPQEKVAPPISYGRDCMRNDGHEDGLIPQAEIDARRLTAVVYREYLDSAYLIPRTTKIIQADINEPVFDRRVPGAVLYARPCTRLKIHVWNTDGEPHSFHVHGLRYGIDSDGSWPMGTESEHGHRSDAICPDETWTYTFDVTDETIGVWPFHDHTHHHHIAIDQGLFGAIVVLGPCDNPPKPCRFPWLVIRRIYEKIALLEGVKLELSDEEPHHHAAPQKHGEHEHGGGGGHDHGAGGHDHGAGGHDHGGGEHECGPDCCESIEPLRLHPRLHAKRLHPEALRYRRDQLDFLAELNFKELILAPRCPNTDHVPIFLHVMSSRDSSPVFDRELEEQNPGNDLDVFEHVFNDEGDFDYFCRFHPQMTGMVHVMAGGPAAVTVNIVDGPPMAFSPQMVTIGVGGTVRWENHSMQHHTVTSREGASTPTHCMNGRGFVGNSPTIVVSAGQRIRFYVFNLDVGVNWHNFHLHSMRWTFSHEKIDVRSIGPAESFIVDTVAPPVVLLDEHMEHIQDPDCRPKDAKRYQLKGDFMFHCHVHHHMMNGMIGIVRSRQTVWLTDEMAEHLRHERGLPLDDGTNDCPHVEPMPCHHMGPGRWEEIVGNPEVAFMHSVLLPNTKKVLYWGYTRADQSRLWDYSTPAGAYSPPANQPAALPGNTINTSDMWSAEHALLNTATGLVLVHGGFSPNRAFTFDPATLNWAQVANTAEDRFYSTTFLLPDGKAMTLFGSASKSIEVYTHGAGWAAPKALPASMNHHQYYPWTWMLPDGRLFIAGPHVPTQRFDWTAAAIAPESFPTIGGNRSTGGEKGTSLLLILRPPDYKPIIYIMGGNTPTTQQTAEQIDASAAAPAWASLPNFNNPRPEQFTATLLPDGRIFIAGGILGGADGGPCETFDPRDPAAGWQLGPNMKYPRAYHSSFLLLSDGSVLGGGDPQAGGGPSAHERFFPGYFDMPRPTISAAPATINYGAGFAISTPNAADITEVILLRPGAVTHGYNMSQRGIECVISGGGAATVNAVAPPSAVLAPPGWYLLFVLDASRVPSEGRWIRLTP